MTNLQTTKLGSFNKEQYMSTPIQISSYVMSALSAQTVALGGGIPSINDKAVNYGIAIGISACANNNAHDAGHGVAIGCETSAVNYGVAIGEKSKADEALAIGPSTEAMHNALALGRYAKATGNYAVQLNGAVDSEANSDDYTFKYYCGKDSVKKNITIVGADGKISADALNTNATITIGITTYNIGISEVLGKDGSTILSAMTLTLV